jgi:hypothetical protein
MPPLLIQKPPKRFFKSQETNKWKLQWRKKFKNRRKRSKLRQGIIIFRIFVREKIYLKFRSTNRTFGSVPIKPVSSQIESDDEDEAVEESYEEWEREEELLEIDESDAALIEKFMTREPKKQINLAEMIMNKINEAEISSSAESAEQPVVEVSETEKLQNAASELDPKIIEGTKFSFCLIDYN